jgi:hypothetical protein
MKIQSRAMLANLSIGVFSPKKTDKKVTREVIDQHQAAESAGKFVKQLLPEEALEAIKKLSTEIRQYHYENTLPWSDEGARILPSAHYMTYVDKMRSFSAQFDGHVDAFMARYDEFRETARGRLKGMYTPGDYPSKDRVRKKFKFKTSFLPLPEASDFRLEMAGAEIQELRAQMEQKVAEASETARHDLWQRLAVPLKTMAERLSDPGAKIYDTLVGNLKDIVGLIPALNVTGDQNLEEIRLQVKAELTRVSTESLRKSSSTRREIAGRANAILATMSGYLPPDGSTGASGPMELANEPEPEPVTPAFVAEIAPIVPEPGPIVSAAPQPRTPSWRCAISRAAVTANRL